MSKQFSIVLLGFSVFERSTLEAFIRTAEARRQRGSDAGLPRFVQASDLATADVVIANADSPATINDSRINPNCTIFIGAHAPVRHLAHLQRPISLVKLMKTLETCVGTSASNSLVGANPGSSGEQAQRVTASVVELPSREASSVHGSPTFSSATMWQGTDSRAADERRILVVDDSDVARRFMVNCLGHFGFEVHMARSGEEALARVAEEHYEFVFMDVNMPGIDGYQACKLIKKRMYPAGRRVPTVVMLTSRSGMIDKVRGTLSHCDAYLTKPLQLDALMKIMGASIASGFDGRFSPGQAAHV